MMRHPVHNSENKIEQKQQIKAQSEDAGIPYWAGDNISEVLQKGDKEELIPRSYRSI